MYSARYVGAGQINPDVPGSFSRYDDGIYGPGYRQPAGPFSSVNFPGTARHTNNVLVNFADGHAKAYGKRATITTAVTPDIYTPGTNLPVYNLPYDLNGIPEAKAEGRT